MCRSVLKPLLYGLLTLVGVLGVTQFLVWAAIDVGAPVLYTAPDTATVPILISPDLRSTGAFSASGAAVFSGIISPPQITATQNDYNPTGFATAQALRLTSNAAQSITGMLAGSTGTWKTLYNIGAFPITLTNGPTASTDANEFALTGNLVLPPGSGVHLQYDGTSARWRTGSRVFLITSVLATQSLGTGTTIQHSGRVDAIEIVQIQSTGGGLTNAAATRILAGVDGQLILLQGMSATATYTIPDGNGVKWATGSSVLFDDRQSRLMEYSTSVGAWREAVTGAGGGGGGGTAASTSFAPTGDITSTNVQSGMSELDSKAEKIARKNLANGYMGLNAAGTAVYDRVGSYATDAALSNSSTITPTALEMGIQGASAPVDLTSSPQIAAGTINGQLLILTGTDDTFTVKIDNGTGVRLCGNTGSLIIDRNGPNALFKWNSVLTVWEQLGCTSAQQAYNAGRTVSIFACGNALNPIFDGGGGTTMEFCLDGSGNATWKVLKSGAATDSIVQLSSGTKFTVRKSDGTTELFSVTDAGAVSGLSTQQSITGGMINVNADCDPSVVQKQYMSLNGRSGGDPFDEDDIVVRWPFAQTFTRLAVKHSRHGGASAAMPAGMTATWRVRKNNTDTSLTCQVTPGQTECTATTPVSIAQNDLVSIVFECLGTSGFIGLDRSYSWSVTAQ